VAFFVLRFAERSTKTLESLGLATEMNLCRFLMMIALSTAAHAEPADGVILLHGLCRSSASMTAMERYLMAQGFIVLNVDYPSRVKSVEELADTIVQNAIQDNRFKNSPKIHFVTHSMGGILVRIYLSRNSPPQLGRVVMLGPPNQGSEVVDRLKHWWLFKRLNGPAGAELGTDSQSTPNSLGPVHFELGVIAGDRSINWINSCWLRGANDGKVSVEKTKVEGMKAHRVVHATHPFIMKNKSVMSDTAAFLKNGSFPE
jgi:triacylglycerol lipase